MRRYQEMGEVRFIWAEPDNHNSQIQLSAIVQAMVQKDYVAVVRTVDRNNSPPKIGVCKPVIDADQLHYLYWVQVSLDCFGLIEHWLTATTRLGAFCGRRTIVLLPIPERPLQQIRKADNGASVVADRQSVVTHGQARRGNGPGRLRGG
jgi:hypothetical protein